MTEIIKPIQGMLTFREAQRDFRRIANKISDTELIDNVQDINSFIWALNLRLESMEAIISLFKDYIKQINKKAIPERT